MGLFCREEIYQDCTRRSRKRFESPVAGGWQRLNSGKPFWASGRALIPKNGLGWPTLSGLVHERVGSFSSPFSNLSSTYWVSRSLPGGRGHRWAFSIRLRGIGEWRKQFAHWRPAKVFLGYGKETTTIWDFTRQI